MSTNAAVARYRSEGPSLVITSGNDRGLRIPVPSTGIVLGREGKLAPLFRDDPLVSRGHAHVYLAEDHSVQVADLNSANGTFVNGEAIRSLTRLTDRDVLRIGSTDMRLDTPRADNRPADETVRLPAARADTMEPVSFAPHPLRLLAFTIDLLLVAAATGTAAMATRSPLVCGVVLLMAWVAYQTGSVWLTGGRTIGKAACNLSVRHIDGSAPRQDPAGLAWAFGRASLGYLIIDMGGLGTLMALRSPRRRCLHDYAFASEVVLHPYANGQIYPRGRLERVRQRLQQFNEDRESAWEAEKKKYAFVAALWKWLVRIPEIILAPPQFARDRWHALVQRLATTAQPTTGAPAANALTVGKITVLVATTSVATGTALAVAATTYLAAPIVGEWGGTSITRAGLDSYQATQIANDYVGPRNGCTFYRGEEAGRISGHGQHYTGYWVWSFGRNGQDCRYRSEPATFDLIGTNTLRVCTTAPALRDDPERCTTWNRTPGR